MPSVSIKGLKKTQAYLEESKRILKGNPALMDSIGNFVVRDIKKIFNIGGDPKWKPSKRAKKGYVVKRGKRKGETKSGKTLQDTGRLRNSITYRTQKGKIIIGTNVKYAAIHNFGGTIVVRGGRKHGQPYLVTNKPFEGAVTFLKKDGKYPAGVRYTKRHKIRMPRRQFMKIRPNVMRGIKSRIKKSVEEHSDA